MIDVLKNVHFTDLFNEIEYICYVDDYDRQGEDIFEESYPERKYYNAFTDEELLELSPEEYGEILELKALFRLNRLNFKLLTEEQKIILARMYQIETRNLSCGKIGVCMDGKDIARILQMIKAHKHIWGPYYSDDEPEKNFSEKHNLDLGPKDYVEILQGLSADDCTGYDQYKVFSFSDENPGKEVLVFDVKKGYKLENGKMIAPFKIYLEIELSRTFAKKNAPMALICFEDE